MLRFSTSSIGLVFALASQVPHAAGQVKLKRLRSLEGIYKEPSPEDISEFGHTKHTQSVKDPEHKDLHTQYVKETELNPGKKTRNDPNSNNKKKKAMKHMKSALKDKTEVMYLSEFSYGFDNYFDDDLYYYDDQYTDDNDSGSQIYTPSYVPTYVPSYVPTHMPGGGSPVPIYVPSYVPTHMPGGGSTVPTYMPSYVPTYIPSYIPTYVPSYVPTSMPSQSQIVGPRSGGGPGGRGPAPSRGRGSGGRLPPPLVKVKNKWGEYVYSKDE